MEQLRGDIASSRPMLTKGCCKGNNYEQRFALDTFPADFSWRNVLAKPCILLFTLQQDCNTREACRLLLVVKVVFVVFPNSAGRIGNSTNPITRFSGWTEEHAFWCVSWARNPLIKIILHFVFKKVAKDLKKKLKHLGVKNAKIYIGKKLIYKNITDKCGFWFILFVN